MGNDDVFVLNARMQVLGTDDVEQKTAKSVVHGNVTSRCIGGRKSSFADQSSTLLLNILPFLQEFYTLHAVQSCVGTAIRKVRKLLSALSKSVFSQRCRKVTKLSQDTDNTLV